jgi:hypothetical protein
MYFQATFWLCFLNFQKSFQEFCKNFIGESSLDVPYGAIQHLHTFIG